MSFDNKASIEHGKVIVGTTTNAQQPVSVWGRRKRNTTVFVSVAVIAMATIAVAVTLLTGKKQANAKEASSSLIVSGTEAIDDQFPYVVSFQNATGSHICGGSLVAKMSCLHLCIVKIGISIEQSWAAVLNLTLMAR
jgi:hypothetical protein